MARPLRTLSPRRSGEPDLIRAYTENKDDAVAGMFLFTNLSDGDYELTILAAGYEPHVSRHRIVGRRDAYPIALTPTK